jgi:hypothetical protein
VAALCKPSIFAIRTDVGFDNTAKACECLSCITQVLYSFWSTFVVDRGCTPP